jgi:PqqD family protein of HPr-rel-A system
MWRVTPGQRLQHAEWDDEAVVFNSLSGDTHLLGAAALHLLRTLQAGPADEAALAAAFGNEPDTGAALAAILGQLETLALVERA